MRQKIIMYCPPAYLTKSKSSVQRYRLFDSVDTRFLCSPQYMKSTESLLLGMKRQGYALDNGAYLDFINNKVFCDNRFLLYCKKYLRCADWVVLPDVVCNKEETIKKSYRYIDRLQEIEPSTKMLFVWQDGIGREDIVPFAKRGIGVFIGGSTDGKIKNMKWLSQLCKEFSVWCHVGRVNTLKRLELCLSSNINSFDGSGIVRFLPTLELLSRRIIQEREQLSLFNTHIMNKNLLETWIKTRIKI